MKRPLEHGTTFLVLVAMASITNASVGAEPRMHAESFNVDPQWEGYRHRLLPAELPTVRQDFGFRTSNLAGGAAAGEIGGTLHRAVDRAYYAKAIKPKTLNERLSASGKFSVPRAGGASAVLVGWFNHEQSQGWRTPSSLAFRIDGNGGKHWLFFEYGASKNGLGGAGAFEGELYQTTKTPPYPADGTVHKWSLDYDPDGAEGRGLIRFRCDDQEFHAELHPGHKEQGATFDRFGVWNQQLAGDSMDVYLDDLVIDGEPESFDEDPQWTGDGNPAEYEQRVWRPYHDFSYSLTNHAGGKPGEIGGVVFRDEAPMYYADRVGSFTLDDELKASGTIAIDNVSVDSALMFGWFSAEAKRREPVPPDGVRSDYLAIVVEGPSRVGHFFRAGYMTSKKNGDAPSHEGEPGQAPVIRPDGAVHRWSLHYEPEAAAGRGRMTTTFDDETRYVELREGARAEGATFDRFGVFNAEAGGSHVRAYLDDVSYSK